MRAVPSLMLLCFHIALLQGSVQGQAQTVDVPLPIKKPAATQKVEKNNPEKPVEPDVWSEAEIIQAHARCFKMLADVSMEVEPMAPVKSGVCGTPAPMRLKAVKNKGAAVRFLPAPTLNCRTISALNVWIKKKVQPAALKYLKHNVSGMRVVAHYACRRRYGNPNKRMSEHAFANAIDISAIQLGNGRWVSILDKWGPTQRDIDKAREEERQRAREAEQRAKELAAKTQTEQEQKSGASAATNNDAREKTNGAGQKNVPLPANKSGLAKQGQAAQSEPNRLGMSDPPPLENEALFLRRIHKDACGIFGTVLGPEANDAHRNHFHLDMAPRKRRAFCE